MDGYGFAVANLFKRHGLERVFQAAELSPHGVK